jgi:hypothetical protein
VAHKEKSRTVELHYSTSDLKWNRPGNVLKEGLGKKGEHSPNLRELLGIKGYGQLGQSPLKFAPVALGLMRFGQLQGPLPKKPLIQSHRRGNRQRLLELSEAFMGLEEFNCATEIHLFLTLQKTIVK